MSSIHRCKSALSYVYKIQYFINIAFINNIRSVARVNRERSLPDITVDANRIM